MRTPISTAIWWAIGSEQRDVTTPAPLLFFAAHRLGESPACAHRHSDDFLRPSHRPAPDAPRERPSRTLDARTPRPRALTLETWRPSTALSGPEKAFLTGLQLDPDSLEVTCEPGLTNFSIVDSSADGFSWAFFDSRGTCCDGGIEPTREAARSAALEVQRLWMHRCHCDGTACSGLCRKGIPPH